MNAKWMGAAAVCAVVFGMFGTPGKARAQVKSDATVDKAVVSSVPPTMFKVEMAGTLTLGSTDTFVGVKITVTDPNNNTYAVYGNAPPPQQGKTSGWGGMYTGPATPGIWTANVSMIYTKADNTQGLVSKSKPFTVGP